MDDEYFLREALKESRNAKTDMSEETDNRFAVGCVIVRNGEVVSKGHTGEEPWNRHAEDTALRKLDNAENATLYTTMEPCGVCLFTGHTSCVELIVERNIKRVVYGTKEPATYVKGTGHEKLKAAGIKVEQLTALAEECLKAGSKQ